MAVLSLLDLRFVLCSPDLDVIRAQRIFYLNYPEINEVEKPITWSTNNHVIRFCDLIDLWVSKIKKL